MTKEDLIAFEEDIAKSFNQKEIRAPVHLYSGNEDEMLKIFEKVRPKDWVFCSWRSHYQCLLKGVPPKELKKAILDGKSISLTFPQYRVFSTAIVGGQIPIALGVALDIKRSGRDEKVYCFVGDMTSETGIMWESFKYAHGHKLPIRFIVEDNGKSVCTETRKVWGSDTITFENADSDLVYYYRYTTKWPHAGAGERVQF